MAAILTLPGVKGVFAAGLSWRHEDTVPKAKELRALSLEKGRWGLVRKTMTGSVQVGFCEPIPGVSSPSKLKSLATIVAEQRPQPWMGLYKLDDDRYWYIAVRDGQEVIPEGDQVGKLEDLLRVREQHLTLGDWEEAEGTVDDLAEMALSTSKHLVLRDLQSRPWVPIAVMCSVMAALGAAALAAWMYHERELEEQRQAALARQRAIAAALQARHDAQARILPWTQEPMPSAGLDVCRQAWSTQQLAVAGWMLSGWHCAIQMHGVSVSADWARSGGTAEQAPGILAPDAQHAVSTRDFTLTFAQPDTRAQVEQTARRAIWTLAQTYGIDLTLSTTPPKPVLPGDNSAKPAPDPWSTWPAKLVLRTPPWMGMGAAFDAIPGLRVESLDWNASTQLWAASATLYALPAGAQAVAAAAVHRPTEVNSRGAL